MKIFIPQKAKEGIGGGWTFTRNFLKFCKGYSDIEIVDKGTDCDIVFIPGPTMMQRDEVSFLKSLGKKIVLRIDNVPRNSRNRNTGTGRLYDLAQMADEVVYQSEWARNFIFPFIQKSGEVILNGADTEIFRKDGERVDKDGSPQYLYSRYNRDETKRWEKAWYDFQRIYFDNPKIYLWIVGQFSPENSEYHFDFFGGAEKRYEYLGVIKDPYEMASIYRSADYLLAPYSMEACSNVVIEARMCGLPIIWDESREGSIYEIMNSDLKDLTLEAMGKKYLEVFNKIIK